MMLFAPLGEAISIGWLNVQSLRNKTDAVEEIVRDRSLDVLALTETWHTDSDDICLRLNKSLKCSRLPVPASSMFEAIYVRLTSAREQVVILNIYRPGSEKTISAVL